MPLSNPTVIYVPDDVHAAKNPAIPDAPPGPPGAVSWFRRPIVVAALVALAGGLVIAIVFVFQASRRPPDAFEVAIFQVLTLAMSVFGALILGQVTSEAEATRRVRQQARPAFRRLVLILKGLGQVATATDDARAYLNLEARRSSSRQ